MIMLFVGIGNSLSDSGLTSSLIRTTNADNTDYSTVFFFNLTGSTIIYLIIFFSAPLIAGFYDQPDLSRLIRVLAISIIIKSFVSVQLTKLKKELQFKKIMTIQLPSTILSGFIGIILALNGAGVWSLIWLTLSQSIIFALQVWIRSKWTPEFTVDFVKLKRHISFGYKLTLAGLLNVIFSNIYNLVIGKWFSAKELGYYNRADTMQGFPLRNTINTIKKVAYPLLSTLQNDDEKLKKSYSKMMLHVAFWITPLMLLQIIIAKPLIEFFLTEKWLPAVPYFQLLCVSSILYPLQEYNLQILDVKGRSDIYLRIEIIKKILIVAAISIAIFFGITGLLYAQIILSILFYLISSNAGSKMINFTLKEQIRAIYPIFLISFAVAFAVWVVNILFTHYFKIPNLLNIIVTSILFISLYMGASYTFKIPVFSDISPILNKLLKRKK